MRSIVVFLLISPRRTSGRFDVIVTISFLSTTAREAAPGIAPALATKSPGSTVRAEMTPSKGDVTLNDPELELLEGSTMAITSFFLTLCPRSFSKNRMRPVISEYNVAR